MVFTEGNEGNRGFGFQPGNPEAGLLLSSLCFLLQNPSESGRLAFENSGGKHAAMPPPATSAVAAPAPRVKPLVWLGWIAILAGSVYFIVRNVPQYFVLTPESYGKYYWPKINWLFPHVIGGLLAAILGPLQFWPKIRRGYLPFHRIAGRIYVVAVLAGAVASFGMSLRITADNAAYGYGLAGLALAWILTTSMAFIAIRRKNLAQHKQWMIRSYVVTFAFVTFRLFSDLLEPANLMPEHQLYGILAWGCWALPLLVTEVILQSAEVFRQRA